MYDSAVPSEKAILGSILLSGDLAYQRCTRLRTEMLSLESHRRIYDVMVEILTTGSDVDYLILRHALEQKKWLEAVGGIGYISDLGSDLPRHFDPSAHIDIVIDAWKLRQVRRICQTISSRADDGVETAGELLNAMQAQVMDLLVEADSRDQPLVLHYSIPELNKLLQQAAFPPTKLVGMSYGIPKLDEFTDGMRNGQVTVVGARSGVGKSSIMLQAAHVNCRKGIPVHIFSLEMTKEQCLRRLWAIESGVPFNRVNKPALASARELESIKVAAQRVAEWPLRIHDKAELDLNQMTALARVSIRRHGTKLFCIDYAQNVEADGRDERTKVARVSKTLTKLAKDEGAHMMLLSQLRKPPSEMYGKPPHVGDLRETGQIENDAHVILLLHRRWEEQCANVATDGEIIVPKQREGRTGAIQVTLDRGSLTFR